MNKIFTKDLVRINPFQVKGIIHFIQSITTKLKSSAIFLSHMPIGQNGEWINPLGVETNLYEGDSKLLQLVSRKVFSPKHTLDLGIYRHQFFKGCNPSSKLFPLIMALWETDDKKRFNDFYSFDNNGVLLSHGYSRWENGKPSVVEQHDFSLDRLLEHGSVITEMIGEYPIPAALASHTTIIDLRNNILLYDKLKRC